MTQSRPATWRDERRQETIAQIKALARAQLSQGGPSALSLRAVAREMRMASATIYRYFDNQAELIGALWADALESLVATVEISCKVPVADGPAERWWLMAHAVRRWGLTHRGDYTMIFGTPNPELPSADSAWAGAVGIRFAGHAVDTYIDADKAGLVDLRTCFLPKNWEPGDLGGMPLSLHDSDRTLHLCALAYNALNSVVGFVNAEVLGNVSSRIAGLDTLFDAHVRTVMGGMGFSRAQIIALPAQS